jgi:DMSO/TMAO reductase YedYZ molybdopterin-dependent catalytic subunit
MDPERRSRAAGSAAAVSGAAASLLVLAVIHVAWPSVPFAPVTVAERILRVTPGGVATFFIELLGALAEPLLVIATAALYLLIAGVLGRRLAVVGGTRARTTLGALTLGVPLAVLALAAEDPGAASVSRPVFALVLLGALAIGAAVTTWRLSTLAYGPAASSGVPDPSRREVVRAVWVGGAGLALAWTGLGRSVLGRRDPGATALRVSVHEAFAAAPPADPAFEAIRGLSPRVTAASSFYTVDTALFDPYVDEETWHLELGGLVDRPSSLAYDELIAQRAVSFDSTLECISNEIGGDLISTGRWTGVPLSTLLGRAGLRDGVVEVVSTSVDGFADSIPIDVAMRDTTIVAFGLDGKRLPTAHGFPARLLVPGRYGMKQPKWLASIEPVDRAFEGYWERRGWSKAAIVKTMSRIDAVVDGAGQRTVAGVAFAGDRGISRVEVSLDGGTTWQDAEIEAALSPLTWRRWRYAFTPATDASVVVTVRGTDGHGEVQTQTITSPHPSGASGYDQAAV